VPVSVFIDVLGIGLIIPVMPGLGSARLRPLRPGAGGLDDVCLHLLQAAGVCRRIRAAGHHLARHPGRRAGRTDGLGHPRRRQPPAAERPRIGSTFFVSAAMQALAVLAARRYFRRARVDPPCDGTTAVGILYSAHTKLDMSNCN
jgi:hypothetical protein